METFALLMNGFSQATTISNLMACLIGCFLGTVVGVLPGIGPGTTLALMIPISYTMSPAAGLIMMLGVYCGAQYGGTITSVLVNVPGEASSVMTAVDGYPLAKQGRGGVAMVLCQVGSFIGGNMSIVFLMVVALPLAEFALRFGPAENFSVIFFALIVAATLISESMLRGLAALAIGLILSVIGTDMQTGLGRLTMGVSDLIDGIDNVVMIIGVFGIGEVLWFVVSTYGKTTREVERTGAGRWIPNQREWRDSWLPMFRGSLTGFLTGLLAAGPALGSFLAYSIEKRLSKHPETFGKGALAGITSCESANNAATGGALIPLLTLGLPHTGAMAILLMVLTMYGLKPGPQMMIDQAPLMWTIIASLYIGNVMLLIMNLPAVGIFIKILDIPLKFLMPLIVVLATVGAFSISMSMSDVALTLIFGVIGFAMRWAGFPQVAMVLGMVMGERLEQTLRQSLLISANGPLIFFTKPISLFFLVLTAALVAVDLVTRRKGRAAGDTEA
jgi:putative tricarboxylic transport membrane protein